MARTDARPGFTCLAARQAGSARGFPDLGFGDPGPGKPRPLPAKQDGPTTDQRSSPTIPSKRLPDCQTSLSGGPPAGTYRPSKCVIGDPRPQARPTERIVPTFFVAIDLQLLINAISRAKDQHQHLLTSHSGLRTRQRTRHEKLKPDKQRRPTILRGHRGLSIPSGHFFRPGALLAAGLAFGKAGSATRQPRARMASLRRYPAMLPSTRA